jgi:hypothetical protein
LAFTARASRRPVSAAAVVVAPSVTNCVESEAMFSFLPVARVPASPDAPQADDSK